MAKKILIIEDSPTIVSLLRNRIEDSGYETIAANDGESGLQMIKEKMPDLIILDVKMPGMDGFEVCRIVKGDPNIKDIPIVFVTASAQKSDIEKYREVGGSGYITKPYEGKALVDEIKKVLKE